MSKQTKDIPPIPTILTGPPASPPSFIPKKEGKENDPLSSYPTNPLPYLTFVCTHCAIRITIQPILIPIHFNQVFCPLCRTLYAYITQDCLPKLRCPEYGPIIVDEYKLVGSQEKKINDRHNAIDLLYQMRYTCQCVGPEPENGWCKHCKRLLQDE